ncbi:MAG: nuclear transport factor 2 family protein [Litorimonas sp.]
MGPADTLRAYFAAYWNGGDVDAFERYVHPDAGIVGTIAGEPIGREDVLALNETFRAMFAEARFTLPHVIEAGEAASSPVMGECTLPDGRTKVPVLGVTFCLVREGRIVRDYTRFDSHEVLIAAGRADPQAWLEALSTPRVAPDAVHRA